MSATVLSPSGVTAAPAQHAGDRYYTLDAVRFLAALGVVWVHTIESPIFSKSGVLGTFGVPFYICVAMFFMFRQFQRDKHLTLQTYYLHRFIRLYVPLLFWTGLSFLAMLLKHKFVSHTPAWPLSGWLLLGASTYQMWFLPFLLIITIPAALGYRLISTYPAIGTKLALSAAVIGTVWAYWPRPDWLNYVDGFTCFYFMAWKAMPSAFCGFAIALFVYRMPKNDQATSALAAIGFFLCWATLGNQYVLGYNRLDRTLSGLGCFLVAFAPLRNKFVECLGVLGRHSYGIYLTHALFVEGLQVIFHWRGFASSPGLDITVFVLAITGSTLLTCLAAKNRWTGLLFGENSAPIRPRSISSPDRDSHDSATALQVA